MLMRALVSLIFNYIPEHVNNKTKQTIVLLKTCSPHWKQNSQSVTLNLLQY